MHETSEEKIIEDITAHFGATKVGDEAHMPWHQFLKLAKAWRNQADRIGKLVGEVGTLNERISHLSGPDQ